MVRFFWVPGHVGIAGNERPERAAKEARRREHVEFTVRSSREEGKRGSGEVGKRGRGEEG